MEDDFDEDRQAGPGAAYKDLDASVRWNCATGQSTAHPLGVRHCGLPRRQRPDQQVSPDERYPLPALCIHGHEWVVYSTALAEGWLMLQCIECLLMGTIDTPSREEWSASSHAPSRPYRWHDDTRVTLRGQAAPRVIRAVDGPVCDCPSELSLPPMTEYERVPGGIWVHPGGLTRRRLNSWNWRSSRNTDLCSYFLPNFVRRFEAHTPKRHSQATHTIVDRIEQWDTIGLHCSPSAVARIIREFSTWEPR